MSNGDLMNKYGKRYYNSSFEDLFGLGVSTVSEIAHRLNDVEDDDLSLLEESSFGAPVTASVDFKAPPVISSDEDHLCWLDFNSGSNNFDFTICLSRTTDRDEIWIETLLDSEARRDGFTLVKVRGMEGERYSEEGDLSRSWEAKFSRSIDTFTIDQLLDFCKRVTRRVFFEDSFTPTPETIFELATRVGVSFFVGYTESSILEAKSEPYDMKSGKAWRVELAEDVARFANSEDGGVLIIGLATEKKNGKELITRASLFPHWSDRVESYAKIIDSRVYPPIEGLKIKEISDPSGDSVAILVPQQREELKPYIVQGAILEGKYEGGMISIPRRRGEASIPITAREIHAMLSAGRSIMRGDKE